MSKKIYNAFRDSFLNYKEGLSIDYKDVAAFCKENNINMDVICFFDYIKDEIDEWAHELGLSYEDDKLYGIGLKPTINVKNFEQFEYFLQK